MPLVNLKPVLREAKAKGYAVAAFNPVDYASMKAMVKAAEEVNAPVIIQSSAKTIKYYGHAAIIGWIGYHLLSGQLQGQNGTLQGYFTRVIWKGILPTGGASNAPASLGVGVISLVD